MSKSCAAKQIYSHEEFGIGSRLTHEKESTEKQASTGDCNAEIYALIKRAMAMQCLFNTMKRTDDSVEKKGNANAHAAASLFGMEVHEMPKNGDCLFNSIGFSVLRYLNEEDSVREHLSSLGLSSGLSLEETGKRLREIMADELANNKEKYSGFLQDKEKTMFQELVMEFRRPGMFSGAMGDLMVKALANVLHLPIVLFTSIINYPVVTIAPDTFADGCSDKSLFAAFIREGPGHYDAVAEKSDRGEEKDIKFPLKKDKCKCGMNNKDIKPVCSNSIALRGRQYSSRCPCLQAQRACSNNCKCKGCKNEYGEKDPAGTTAVHKRKRCEELDGSKRKKGIEFLIQMDETVTGGHWTEGENFIFLQIVIDKPEVLEGSICKEMVEDLTDQYNRAATLAIRDMGVVDVNVKTSKSIEGKLSHLKKKKELAYLIVEEQINLFIDNLRQCKGEIMEEEG